MDTDLALDHNIFVIDLQDANKNYFFYVFCFLLFKGIFTSFFKKFSGVFLFRPGTQGADSPPPFL
jgi:hypothetical protein